MNSFGIYCWHAYNTNPKLIELLISDNNKNNNFKSLGIYELEMKDGIQLFPIDYNVLDDTSIKNRIKSIKIVIKEAHGGNKTYINQIMFYENTTQEIINSDSIQNSINTFKHENNMPEDLSNSQISIEEKEKEVFYLDKNNKKGNSQNERNIKNNVENKNKNNIIDYISEANSKNSEKSEYNENNDSLDNNIKVEENNGISENSKKAKNNQNEEEESEENEENEENEELKKIIPTSNELQYPYINKFDRQNNDTNINNFKKINPNLNQDNNINKDNSKKIKKLEKILKQNILKNEHNKYIDTCIQNENLTEDYNENEKYRNNFNYVKNKTINNINNYPSLTPVMKNGNDIHNYESQRNSNLDENMMQINNIQKYFKFNANTPNRFNVNGYEYLINKKRPDIPKINEINIKRNTIPTTNNITNNNVYKNKTYMGGFTKANNTINIISSDIKNSKEYETLEMQLQDMEQHLQNMALNRDIISSNNSNGNYVSRTNREFKDNNNKFYNNDIYINNNYIDKKTKNNSINSNGSSYIVEEPKSNNLNTNIIMNNNSNINDFNKYNSPHSDLNNDEESIEINKRIDNLEKNIYEIKDELNNISSNLKIFLNKDTFLYNFRDSIKQICYDFFSERINMENNEQIKNENENEYENENQNENVEKDNSQDSGEYSMIKNNQNENNKIEEEINKKIDEKLEYLCNNLKNQIFEKYLQPSINEIEKSMKQNIEDIKEKVDSINNTNISNNSNLMKNNHKYYNIIEDDEKNNNYNGSIELNNRNEEQNSKGDIYHKTSSKVKRQKYEEINRLGEKLYDKLLEKERKLQLLKQETMKY